MGDEVNKKQGIRWGVIALCLDIAGIVVFFIPAINHSVIWPIFLLAIILGILDSKKNKVNIISGSAIFIGALPYLLILSALLMSVLFPGRMR